VPDGSVVRVLAYRRWRGREAGTAGVGESTAAVADEGEPPGGEVSGFGGTPG